MDNSTVGTEKSCHSFYSVKPFCFVSYSISICTVVFLLICRVFIVLYGVLTADCVFETCEVKSVF